MSLRVKCVVSEDSPVSATVRTFLVQVDENPRVSQRSSSYEKHRSIEMKISELPKYGSIDRYDLLTSITSGYTTVDQPDRFLFDQFDGG